MNNTNDKPHAAEMILGEVASPGLARGRALACNCAQETIVPRRQINEAEAQAEIGRFDAAIEAVERVLRDAQAAVGRAVGKRAGDVFEAQILLMRDEHLRQVVSDLCVTKRMNAEAAVEQAIQQLAMAFDKLESPYIRERAADLRELGRLLISSLTSHQGFAISADSEDCVLVTSELPASAVAQLKSRSVRGIIVECGGLMTHATILVRALGIPMLVKASKAVEKISTGDLVIVDALAGRVFINPKPEIARTYDQVESALQARREALKELLDLPAITRDGVEIKLSANVGQTADAVAAARVKADGAGLYRTEFVFLAEDHFPSEEEQYRFYRATAERLQPGRTVIRVLDTGSDKPLAYFPLPREPNPALGSRGIGLLLAHVGILRAQLRAILRLSATHPVSVLLPMVRGTDDLRATKAVIEEVKTELASANIPFDPAVPVGVMIETPSAAMLIAQLADEADFFSVGTNDLVQYLLAADRANGQMDSAYEPLHPAVLHTLATLAATAEARRKPISVCGEIASDPLYIPLLVGLGFRSFSVTPARLLEIKQAVRSIDAAAAREFAKKILSRRCAQDIRTEVRHNWSCVQPSLSPDHKLFAPLPLEHEVSQP